MSKRRKRRVLLVVAVLAAALSWWLLGLEDRGPIYEGRPVANWVAVAMRIGSTTSERNMVVQIGAPAVPFIAKQGLHDRSHTKLRPVYRRIESIAGTYPAVAQVALKMHLVEPDTCVWKHYLAMELLSKMGTNGAASVPEIIACIGQCPYMRFEEVHEMLDTLGAVGGTSPVAIAYLTKTARESDMFSLRAAAQAYYINGDTNLMVETCERLARQYPINLFGQELFWFREDHELNQHLVPLLERLYDDPRLDDPGRADVLFQLESRSNDATAAISRLLARQTNAPVK